MQLSLSAEPALGLVLGFSEVTGLFPQASSATGRPPLQAAGLRGKTWRTGSWLRPPPAASLRTPSSREAGPASPCQISPDSDLPGPEKPPSQGRWPHPHLVLGSHFVVLLCTTAITMPGPARQGEQKGAGGPATAHKEWPGWRGAGPGAAGYPASWCPCSSGL